MSITSVSFTFVNMYASQAAAKPVAAAERPAPARPVESAHDHSQHHHLAKPNRLVQAMMTALRELGVGGQASAAPSASAASAAAGAAANDASAVAARAGDAPVENSVRPAAERKGDVESAVHQFAHELMKALRQAARGEAGGEGRKVDGEHGGHRHHHRMHDHHHHHHHAHHGWRREGYGDMSQRLDALAQKFGPQQPDQVAAKPVATSMSITLTMQVEAADASMPVAQDVVSADKPIAEVASEKPPVALETSPVQVKNPLLEAFSKLFSALQAPASGSMNEGDMGSRLRLFLQSLAQALRPEELATPEPRPVGGLLDLAA